ncbi:MAG: Maf family nucleotide pyrophosphatase [Rhizobiaceae bacterium]
MTRFKTGEKIILASGSRIRAELLRSAGISFETIPAQISERDVEQPLVEAEADGEIIAEVLAQAKAAEVASRNPGRLVIGCDQTLSLDGQLLHKPQDMEDAARRLLALSGREHHLNSAVCIQQDETCLWSHVDICRITFRQLEPAYIGRHLAEAGPDVLSSVGAYQIEGLGIQLVEKITGDIFSIQGLPVIPLLEQLRKLGIMET